MPNFACQNRDDERYLTNALQQHGLNTVKVVVVTGNIDEHIGSETANLGNYGVVASLNEVHAGGWGAVPGQQWSASLSLQEGLQSVCLQSVCIRSVSLSLPERLQSSRLSSASHGRCVLCQQLQLPAAADGCRVPVDYALAHAGAGAGAGAWPHTPVCCCPVGCVAPHTHTQLFDAPPLARHALNNVCGLDSSYVMTQHDLDTAKAMMETHPKVRRVYSPEVRECGARVVFCRGGVSTIGLQLHGVCVAPSFACAGPGQQPGSLVTAVARWTACVDGAVVAG